MTMPFFWQLWFLGIKLMETNGKRYFDSGWVGVGSSKIFLGGIFLGKKIELGCHATSRHNWHLPAKYLHHNGPDGFRSSGTLQNPQELTFKSPLNQSNSRETFQMGPKLSRS